MEHGSGFFLSVFFRTNMFGNGIAAKIMVY